MEELLPLTYTQFYNESVVMEIGVEYPQENEYEGFYSYCEYFSVYESFEKTLALLKEYGAAPFHEAENIRLLELELYNDEIEKSLISDSAQLEALRDEFYISEFNYIYDDDVEWVYGTLKVSYDGIERYLDINIKKSVLDNLSN